VLLKQGLMCFKGGVVYVTVQHDSIVTRPNRALYDHNAAEQC